MSSLAQPRTRNYDGDQLRRYRVHRVIPHDTCDTAQVGRHSRNLPLMAQRHRKWLYKQRLQILPQRVTVLDSYNNQRWACQDLQVKQFWLEKSSR